MALVEGGIISKWLASYQKMFFKTTSCQKNCQDSPPPVEVVKLAGPFIFLGLGVSISFCVFLIEFFIKGYSNEIYTM